MDLQPTISTNNRQIKTISNKVSNYLQMSPKQQNQRINNVSDLFWML